MEKIIPFKKDIIFKTNVSEITSISLEHNLTKKEENFVSGSFTVSGEYKMAEDSVTVDSFSYDLPFDINIDKRYDTTKLKIDIDDFYYEIINDNVLSVSIDVLLSHLEEMEEREEIKEGEIDEVGVLTQELHEEEVIEEKSEEKMEEKNRCIEPESLFENMDQAESYLSYKVYIVREGDTLEKIMEQYQVTKEDLAAYNDLSEIKINDKIIIPANNDENI